ncbi:MAG: helix-turn-helix domain-containing protein [Oscillospiraceae bacterium]|nr:helix-turn-helix domain-containing protein [Oscillospiraceae bacterium]
MTSARKEELLNQILDLMTAVAYDREPDGFKTNTITKSADNPVEMLTVKECTEVIQGLSEHTVRQLVAQGKVKSVRTGEGKRGKILVNKADLISYFQK